jgi:hypothetical protein
LIWPSLSRRMLSGLRSLQIKDTFDTFIYNMQVPSLHYYAASSYYLTTDIYYITICFRVGIHVQTINGNMSYCRNKYYGDLQSATFIMNTFKARPSQSRHVTLNMLLCTCEQQG